jgi:3-deoxy-D-manno-octulosonic-acid transferase
MFWLYNIFILLLSPLWVPWMLIRTRRRAEGVDWKQRMGDYKAVVIPKEQPAIWIHAVSVGEVMAALPILRQVRALLPDHHIVLSVTTSSGHRTARENALEFYDSIVYFPVDVLRFQMSALMRVRPEVVAIMETELWFNFLWAARTLGARTLLVNGRISDRSFRRSRWVAFLYESMLKYMDRCLMQNDQDAERIKVLGGKNVEVFGNSKFDQAVDGLDADIGWWRESLGVDDDRPILAVREERPEAPDEPSGEAPTDIVQEARRSVVVVGSTRSDLEEHMVADALKGLDIAVVWAPRHIERADHVASRMIDAFGACDRRSLAERGRYVLLDTYGELAKVYAIADIVIIGGGFDDLGGQNLLQPMAHGKPVLHGPHMQNFRDVTQAAMALGASRECRTAQELRAQVIELLGDPMARATMGQAGQHFVKQNEGASRRYADAIHEAAETP